MDEQFLVSQSTELRAQLASLRAARDRLASAAMGAADEMARKERLEPGLIDADALLRSRRAQCQLAEMDEQIKSLTAILKTVEDQLARTRETG